MIELILLGGALYFLLRDRIRPTGKALQSFPAELQEQIRRAASKTGVPENIIAAVVMVESGGNRLAVGGVGERGLMQLRPIALDDINAQFGTAFSFAEMFLPEKNLEAGALFLKLQRRRMGNWPDAIRAYNAGERGARLGRGKEYWKRVQKWL